jgi:hypothetical protein
MGARLSISTPQLSDIANAIRQVGPRMSQAAEYCSNNLRVAFLALVDAIQQFGHRLVDVANICMSGYIRIFTMLVEITRTFHAMVCLSFSFQSHHLTLV